MSSFKVVVFSILQLSSVLACLDCPPLPDYPIINGDAVPMTSADIPQGCSSYEIIVARGVGELNYEGGHGKFGAIVGDPVVSNVTKALKKSRGYPVQYPASSNVIADTRQGAHDIVGRLMAQAANCPDQTFSLVGYSQGAGVIHAAADEIPRNLYPRIKSLVLFGDGFQLKGKDLSSFPDGLDEKVLQVCARDDPVCNPHGSCTSYHLIYNQREYIDLAVKYIVAKFRS